MKEKTYSDGTVEYLAPKLTFYTNDNDTDKVNGVMEVTIPSVEKVYADGFIEVDDN